MALLTRFAIRLATGGSAAPDGGVLERLSDVAGAAESAGFDTLWVADRPGDVLSGAGALEASTVLGALARRTTRMRLGPLVTPAGTRPPSLVAKQMTTLDVLSAGRAVLGLGAGRAVPGGGVPSRFEELEDALRICRAMFEDEAPSLEGRLHRVAGAANRPRPVQQGGPRIVVGGNGERRTLPLAVRYADGCNLIGPPDVLGPKVEVVRRLCGELGRDRAEFTVTALLGVAAAGDPPLELGDPAATAARIGSVLDCGVDGVVLDLPLEVGIGALARLGTVLVESYGSFPAGS